MNIFEEHRAQTYLVGLQILTIIGGSLMVTAIMKNTVGFEMDTPLILRIVRSYGMFLLLIPTTWAYVTVKYERDERVNYRPIWTIISGVAILVALAWLFFDCFMAAFFLPTNVVHQ